MHALTWLNASSTYFSFRNLMTMFLIVIVGSSLMCHLCVFPFYFEKSMQIRRSQTSLVSLVIIMSWVGSRNISFMPAQHSHSALRVLPLLWSCDADRGYQSWEPLHSLVTERGSWSTVGHHTPLASGVGWRWACGQLPPWCRSKTYSEVGPWNCSWELSLGSASSALSTSLQAI